ncbi:AAA family ATPase [Desulfopila aestuarii]|uniref:AAA family ATPase n=1 Tax=Desulfopila aestuarii TaxID=231440 RepID=UPI0013565854|nr:AAA family ATPase [Desulfopila aestuarii]
MSDKGLIAKGDDERVEIKTPCKKTYDSTLVGSYAVTSSELAGMEFVTSKYFVPPFLYAQSISMIYSPPGVGKSMVVHGFCSALTREKPEGLTIGPWEIINGCGVLLVDGELPMSDLKKRLSMISKGLGGEHCQNRLLILSSVEVQEKTGEPINLTKVRYREEITNHFLRHPEYRVLVLDNLTSLTDGMNENTKTAWAPINRWLLQLRNIGVAIILVHHANKSGTDRGHSSIRDNVNNIISLKRVKGAAVDDVHLKAVFEKGRDLEPGEGNDVKLKLIKDEHGGLRFVCPQV